MFSENRNSPLRLARAAWPGIALMALVALLFYRLPSGYWRADDPALLLHALQSAGLKAFYDPADWQKLSPSNLTPWITLSFKTDLWLAGLSPRLFYVHQLVAIWLVGLAAYVLVRQWVPAAWALASAGLFLGGAPVSSVAEVLMTRHYLEGLLFALLAVLAFLRALRRQSVGWACAGAAAYALAASAKEIYVPLVLIVLVLPPLCHQRARVRLVAPFLAVAALYVPWRMYMLGSAVGGYAGADSVLSLQSVSGMGAALTRVPEYLFGPWWPLPTVAFVLAFAVVILRRPAAAALAGVVAASVVLPLVPLVAYPGISGPDRYLFLFWFVAATGFVLVARQIALLLPRGGAAQSVVGLLLCTSAIVPALVQSTSLAAGRAASYREFEVQGRFIAEAGQGQAYVPTATLLASYWYATSLCAIRQMSEASCPTALIKGFLPTAAIVRLYVYDPARAEMVDVTSRMEAEISRIGAVDVLRPLRAEVALEAGRVVWQLGPYEAKAGQYYAVSPAIGRFPIPRTGELRMAHSSFAFHVQYDAPEGWTTSSPRLEVEAGRPVTWRRHGNP